jgi:hypothetical protein
VSVLLIGVGFLLQITTRNILAGLPLIIACLILNLLKGISVKRVKAKKLTWQEVTPLKIDQVIEQCKRIKKFRSKGVGCFIAVILFLIFGFSFGAPFLALFVHLPFALCATVVNAIILFGGLAFSGRKSAWMPRALDIKAGIVKRLLGSSLIKGDPNFQAIPYDFIGLQGQISINSVKGRPYPYFYIVLIAKHSFNLLKKFGKKSFEKLVVERKKTGEVDVVVIRQRTTKTSGYHTNVKVQDYTLETGLKVAKSLLEPARQK